MSVLADFLCTATKRLKFLKEVEGWFVCGLVNRGRGDEEIHYST